MRDEANIWVRPKKNVAHLDWAKSKPAFVRLDKIKISNEQTQILL